MIEENKSEQIQQSDIKITSINEEAIKKIPKGKITLKKVLLGILISSALTYGGFNLYQSINPNRYDDVKTVEEIFEDKTGIVEVDGIEIDLDQLKEQYGTAFYLYEPLTNEQVEEQFKGIMLFQSEMWLKYRDIDESIGFVDQYGFVFIEKYSYNFLNNVTKMDFKYLKPFLLENKQYQKYFTTIDGNETGFDIYIPELHDYYGLNDIVNDTDELSMEIKKIYVKYWKYTLTARIEALKDVGIYEEYKEYNSDLFFEQGINYNQVVKINI